VVAASRASIKQTLAISVADILGTGQWGAPNFVGRAAAGVSLQTKTYVILSYGKGLEDNVRPGRGASGTLRQELFLVAIPNKVEAVRAVQACLPDAEVKIDSEASPDIFAEYQVSDGEMFVLPEGS
jgi:hypothetical protein